MKNRQQILHIHGGNAFSSYENYISYLSERTFNPYKTNKNRWNRNYYNFLDENYFEVFRPDMPCAFNAKYYEWKIWFEKIFPYLVDNIILIGHSLGGTFLAKYLSENDFQFKIKQLHLIAPVYDYEDSNEQLADFKITEFPKDFLKNDIDKIHIYHSEDDKYVPISESKKYHTVLPGSHFHKFHDRGHFLDETFPELFNNIKE